MDDRDTRRMLEYLGEIQNPIHHLPTNLGIKEFKKVVKSTSLPKASQNKLIKAYKKRSWMEFAGVTRGRGTFPTYPEYGKKVGLETDESETTAIKVKHG